MTGLWLVSYVALWVFLLIIAVALLSVLRNLGVIYESLADSRTPTADPTKLVAGASLPALALRTLAGSAVDLAAFRGTKTAFSVISPQCAPCHLLLRDIAAGRGVVDPLDPSVRQRVILSVGDLAATAALVGRLQLPGDLPVLVDAGRDIEERWGITSTPTTVIVDEQLRVVRRLLGAPDMARVGA